MISTRRLGQAAAFIAIAAVFGFGSHYLSRDEPASQGGQAVAAGATAKEASAEAESEEDTIGGPFSLVNTEGERVSPADFQGEYTLVLFGYTFCPDVCPMSLIKITRAIDMLAEEEPEKAERVTPVFITVDPARDDVAAMRDYVSHFHPRLVGLTGSEAEIEEAAAAYQVVYWRVDSERTTEYTVAHTSYSFLMGPDGEYITRFDHDTPPELVARTLKAHVRG